MSHRVLNYFIILLLTLTFQNNRCVAQEPTAPPKPEIPFWTISINPTEMISGKIVTLIIKAKIHKDWYVYSNDFDPDLGPNVAELLIDKSSDYTLVGNMKPVGSHKENDEVFGGVVSKFTGQAEFRQQIKILKDHPVITGKFSYQTCSMISGMCVTRDVKINVSDGKKSVDKPSTTANSVDKFQTETTVVKNTLVPVSADSVKSSTNITSVSNNPKETNSFGTQLILAFVAGLLVLLTPCVFPMVPMTVAFFSKLSEQEGGRKRGVFNGLIYGISIILIYTIPGTIISVLFGAAFGNWLSTHWVPNVLFFIIFIVFAASFLGMFEINLSGGFVNKMDNKASRQSLIGIFFMAFTLVLVSFSCTGPIVSSVIISAIGGSYMKALLMMLSFSTAVALPFVLFAMFPRVLQSLPKAGGWLNSVKVSFGFLELAAAFKFLSVPDQTYHWGFLDREVYLIIWIIVFGLWGLYLLGKLKFSHDSDLPYLSVPRLFLAITVFSFTLYMIPGLWGAPLKMLSGYLPPMETQDFNLTEVSHIVSANNTDDFPASVKYSGAPFNLKLPHRLKGFFDFNEASAYSQKVKKPIFIDFTGHGCVNCRLMENNVWSDKEVLKRLKNDFVVVAMYADDKIALPETEWYKSTVDGEIKKTLGDQVSDFQFSKFQGAAQPQYVLTDAQGNRLLNYDKFYDSDIANFIRFLDEGKAAFHKK